MASKPALRLRVRAALARLRFLWAYSLLALDAERLPVALNGQDTANLEHLLAFGVSLTPADVERLHALLAFAATWSPDVRPVALTEIDRIALAVALENAARFAVERGSQREVDAVRRRAYIVEANGKPGEVVKMPDGALYRRDMHGKTLRRVPPSAAPPPKASA